MAKNVLGKDLETCCSSPMTGFYRNGKCETGAGDYGLHTVCSVMTDEFLAYSASRGNDLSTPSEEMSFPGLKAGDRWCLCATRWKQALEEGMAPQVILAATHISTLEFVSIEELREYAVDADVGA